MADRDSFILGEHFVAVRDIAADLGVEVNPRLWFKGFRSNVDDELFRTIAAVEP